MEKLAWLAANIMNASGNLRQAVTPDMLLGKTMSKTKKARRISREEWEREVQLLLAEFGEGGENERRGTGR